MTSGGPGSLLGRFVGTGRPLRLASSSSPRSCRMTWTGPPDPRPAPTARRRITPSSSEPSPSLQTLKCSLGGTNLCEHRFSGLHLPQSSSEGIQPKHRTCKMLDVVLPSPFNISVGVNRAPRGALISCESSSCCRCSFLTH